ncbi:hypothetical protein HNY73_007585 [Argiope bruennichi]|uniref:Gustatory receptor n=1 Tax=Argiope bruennichi TaxID=94029 RepID=A0A8T0FFB7_ARGBR|nr:hypothetical protein HNY73_007585 [Argiope bruennichi]
MTLSTDIKVLIRSFNIIGIPFNANRKYDASSSRKVSKRILYFLLELTFFLFDAFNVLRRTLWISNENIFYVLTTSATSLSIMALRLSIAFKRKEIISLVFLLQNFTDNYQIKKYTSRKKELDILCYLNLIIPPAFGTIFVVFFHEQFDELRDEYMLDYCSRYSVREKIYIILFTFAYSIHFYVTSLLCMTLFIAIFNSYADALRQMLTETYRRLRVDISLKNIAYASEMILKAQKVHQRIEDVLSFSILIAYLLVFVNFLNLVSISVSDFAHHSLQVRAIACSVIFCWTTASFVKLTLAGSRLVDACEMWKHYQKDIVRHCSRIKFKREEELAYLLMFLEESKIDLAFTGWGIFRLERSLLLTIAEAIVSYSVLVATV